MLPRPVDVVLEGLEACLLFLRVIFVNGRGQGDGRPMPCSQPLRAFPFATFQCNQPQSQVRNRGPNDYVVMSDRSRHGVRPLSHTSVEGPPEGTYLGVDDAPPLVCYHSAQQIGPVVCGVVTVRASNSLIQLTDTLCKSAAIPAQTQLAKASLDALPTAPDTAASV